MCHLPLSTGEVRASTAKDLHFSPQSLNIKQFTINMHSNKVFKKAWYAWHATTKGAWITLIKPFGGSKVKLNQNKLYTKLIKYLTSTNF